MKQFAEQVKTMVFELNEHNEMKQNVRNGFKALVLKAFADMTVENAEDTVEVLMVDGGFAVKFQNGEEGAVTVVVDVTVKPFTFDADFENAEFVNKQAEKAEKALKAQAEKEKKMAEKKVKAKA